MRQLVYTMHFRGQAAPAAADPNVLRETSTATSCVVNTTIRESGLDSELKAAEGELAFLEAELHIISPGSFQQSGIITFGDETDHLLRFSTLDKGHFTSGIAPGLMAGTVSWKIEGGSGQFAHAQGFITSNFLLTESGDLSDYQSGLIFLPE